MRLEQICEMDLRYTSEVRLARPYGGEEGLAWGTGDGSVAGERLSGSAEWSNHPRRRADGSMLPDARGVIRTGDEAEVFFDLTGRTTWVVRDGDQKGSQLLMTLFETEAESYKWLNNTVCMTEGVIDPRTLVLHLRVFACHNDLV